MKYIVVSSSEWTYPDRAEYDSAGQAIDLHAPRNSFATAQLLLTGLDADGAAAPVSVKAAGQLAELPLTAYELVPAHVEGNPGLPENKVVNGCPSRWAPFDVYDCIKPLGAAVNPKGGVAGLYLSFTLDAGARPGAYAGEVCVECGGNSVSIPARVTAYKAVVPEDEHIKIVNGYYKEKTVEYHNVEPDSPEYRRLELEYWKMLRRMRQNTLYAGGIKATQKPDGSYEFDFGELERFMKDAIALGYKYFNTPTIGWRESWKRPEINVVVGGVRIPAMSYEAYVYLTQYFKAFRKFLADRGWLDKIYVGVADEPNLENATVYRALCGMLRKLAPDMRLIDAVSFVPIYGALDCMVPLNSEYEKHKKEFDSLRGENDEMWHYVCCGPRSDGYINRFMDYPLLSTRYLFWGNYKYKLDGYLHWASNCYQPNQDPFKLNCPLHRNTDSQTILPSGDTHIIYPGEDGPWMSIRLEAQRQSAEDFELLRMLAQSDPEKADALCGRCFRSFNDVEYDINAFEAAKKEIYEAVSAI